MRARKPTFEDWRAQQRRDVETFFRENVTSISGLAESFGAIDVLFFFLGVSTAFSMVGRAEVAA